MGTQGPGVPPPRAQARVACNTHPNRRPGSDLPLYKGDEAEEAAS